MTLTDEQRATVECVLKSETTEAYNGGGFKLFSPFAFRLFHSKDKRDAPAVSQNDTDLMLSAPLLKATILEQRERIAELEGMVEHVCYVRDNLLNQKLELQDRLRTVGESYDNPSRLKIGV
jgi:hypothetical protein